MATGSQSEEGRVTLWGHVAGTVHPACRDRSFPRENRWMRHGRTGTLASTS